MSGDKVAAFAGSLTEHYDRYLLPLNFAPYAEVVADRAKALHPRRVLETAAGTGVVTEALARILPTDVTITATFAELDAHKCARDITDQVVASHSADRGQGNAN